MQIKHNFFKRALSGVLSAACVLSGTAFAGMTALSSDEPIEAKAATASSTPEFSWDNATVYFLLTDRFKMVTHQMIMLMAESRPLQVTAELPSMAVTSKVSQIRSMTVISMILV